MSWREPGILGNWDGIRGQYEPDYEDCSAEEHANHILLSRLSSRPLGWCQKGVDQMARLGEKCQEILTQASNHVKKYNLCMQLLAEPI